MKKLVFTLTLIAIICAMSACGENNSETQGSKEPETQAVITTTTTSITQPETNETTVKILSWSLSKDFADADVLVVNYEFYNGDNKSNAFAYMFTDTAYQGGVECDDLVVGCDEVDAQTQLDKIKPGVAYTVKVGYHIKDMSDVEVEVKSLFGNKEYLKETIKLS